MYDFHYNFTKTHFDAELLFTDTYSFTYETTEFNEFNEFNEFKDTSFYKKILRHRMRRIQSKKHKIGTYEIDKISLSCFDDKRSVSDGIHMLAYFHKDLKIIK